MSISVLTKAVLLAVLLLAPLNAEEIKESLNCDEKYDLCNEKCEESDNPLASCFKMCDDQYDKCIVLSDNENQGTD